MGGNNLQGEGRVADPGGHRAEYFLVFNGADQLTYSSVFRKDLAS